jgi:hypothetical protein
MIKDVNDRDSSVYKRLLKLTETNKIECLKAFSNNMEFVNWLRQNAPTINDLKLLTEFAAESEGALEISKLQKLIVVGTCYQPLIYGLKEKQKSSFNDLLELVEAVVFNLKNNPDLGDSLATIANQTVWLADIKESKGNAGLNSLKQAERINKKGVYVIGFSARDDLLEVETLQNKENMVELQTIIALKVEEETIKEKKEEKEIIHKLPKRVYNYKKILELHDKLTLVVGRSENEGKIIKYFEDVSYSHLMLISNFIKILNFFSGTGSSYLSRQYLFKIN